MRASRRAQDKRNKAKRDRIRKENAEIDKLLEARDLVVISKGADGTLQRQSHRTPSPHVVALIMKLREGESDKPK